MKKIIFLLVILAALAGCSSRVICEESLPETTETVTEAPSVITENALGTVDGHDYELWKDQGTTEMTLTGEGNFTCNWSYINNALFRIGKKFDCTKTWEEIGTIALDYAVDYFPVATPICAFTAGQGNLWWNTTWFRAGATGVPREQRQSPPWTSGIPPMIFTKPSASISPPLTVPRPFTSTGAYGRENARRIRSA